MIPHSSTKADPDDPLEGSRSDGRASTDLDFDPGAITLVEAARPVRRTLPPYMRRKIPRPARRDVPAPQPLTVGDLLGGILSRGAQRALALAAVLGILCWSSPLLPGAVHLGDAALGAGRPDIAAQLYDQVSTWGLSVDLRRKALERGALVYATELGQPVEARIRLEDLARTEPPPVVFADAKARIAGLLAEEGRPLEAARLLRESHAAHPDNPVAAERLVRAAELVAAYGEVDEALGGLADVARRYPTQRARANIGRAQLLLARGDALAALGFFEDAVDRTYDGDLVAVAKLGAATCLERLGSLDEALAELDHADLPAEVRFTRQEGMRARLQ